MIKTVLVRCKRLGDPLEKVIVPGISSVVVEVLTRRPGLTSSQLADELQCSAAQLKPVLSRLVFRRVLRNEVYLPRRARYYVSDVQPKQALVPWSKAEDECVLHAPTRHHAVTLLSQMGSDRSYVAVAMRQRKLMRMQTCAA